ncbi:hypothetical protein HPB50_006491 [Hyalomma asiaticum]|uniref:Uncharacterized protein n=1 Tax=Hyalomma asiaticum TaxID=266040 RepID=A0ACB7SFF9_HYAAI|nr:hypothetical protein HPB50_006491 [Hyalomma asiaticum]
MGRKGNYSFLGLLRRLVYGFALLCEGVDPRAGKKKGRRIRLLCWKEDGAPQRPGRKRRRSKGETLTSLRPAALRDDHSALLSASPAKRASPLRESLCGEAHRRFSLFRPPGERVCVRSVVARPFALPSIIRVGRSLAAQHPVSRFPRSIPPSPSRRTSFSYSPTIPPPLPFSTISALLCQTYTLR